MTKTNLDIADANLQRLEKYKAKVGAAYKDVANIAIDDFLRARGF